MAQQEISRHTALFPFLNERGSGKGPFPAGSMLGSFGQLPGKQMSPVSPVSLRGIWGSASAAGTSFREAPIPTGALPAPGEASCPGGSAELIFPGKTCLSLS